MKVLEIEGRTVDDATKKALNQLGIRDMSRLKIETLDQGKSGIFGFGVSRPAKIRVFYNENIVDVGETTKDIINNLLNLMELKGIVKDIKEGENKVYVELESESSGIIIGKKGKNLEALQFIVNLIVNHKTETDKKIILDIESYRAKRERALRKISREAAQRVIKSGKPYVLEPMNPFERRLIHLTLQNDTRVVTKSEGQGAFRKVKVFPANHK